MTFSNGSLDLLLVHKSERTMWTPAAQWGHESRGVGTVRQSASAHVSTLRDYLQVARRRKWIIIQAALIVPLAALAFSINQQAQYQGSAEVLLSTGPDLSDQLTGTPSYNNTPADRLAQTQASLARV